MTWDDLGESYENSKLLYNVIIKCWKWKSLLIIHSLWKNSLFHSGSQVGRRNEVTFKLSGASFHTYAFFFVFSTWTFQNVFVRIPVPTPHSLTLHQEAPGAHWGFAASTAQTEQSQHQVGARWRAQGVQTQLHQQSSHPQNNLAKSGGHQGLLCAKSDLANEW